jgi:hypothetical protein
MQVPVNGHPFPFFPPLDRRHITFEVRGDFLPGIQPVMEWYFGPWCAWDWFAHRVFRTDTPAREAGNPIIFAPRHV